MRVAIVYDRVNKWGGAERVLLALHGIFPQAPLYTSVYDARNAPWAKVFPKIYTSFLQRLPLSQRNHDKLAFLMPLAFESFDFSEYDLVISVTSEAAKGIITQPRTKHICYCLTPTRYLWSGYDFYFQNKILRFFSKPAVSYLRNWDKVAAQRPDTIIAISTVVQKRIKKYYGREAKLIYPPAGKFQTSNIKSQTNYFLVVSRLVPYKRVGLVVKAFNELELPLVIVGTGSEAKKLQKIARENIKFVGQLTDRQLANYYRRSRALIFAQEEDFGLVAVEAQSFGLPVIAFKAGGALDIVKDGKTGIFFAKQEEKNLIKAIRRFEKLSFNWKIIKKNAQKFTQKRFKRQFQTFIQEGIGGL